MTAKVISSPLSRDSDIELKTNDLCNSSSNVGISFSNNPDILCYRENNKIYTRLNQLENLGNCETIDGYRPDPILPFFTYGYDCGNTSRLFEGIKDNDLPKVKNEVKRLGTVNLYNKWGHTPLTAASMHGYLEIVKYLVANGADVNLENIKNNRSPLDYAESYKRYNIIYVLKKNKATNGDHYFNLTGLPK